MRNPPVNAIGQSCFLTHWLCLTYSARQTNSHIGYRHIAHSVDHARVSYRVTHCPPNLPVFAATVSEQKSRTSDQWLSKRLSVF